MKRALLIIAASLVAPVLAAQDDAPRASATKEQRASLTSLLRWSFDGRPRFGAETWREEMERQLARGEGLADFDARFLLPRPSAVSPEAYALLLLSRGLGPYKSLSLKVKEGVSLEVENKRLRVVASLKPRTASVAVSHKAPSMSEARVSLIDGRFEVRVTEAEDRRCLVIERGKARYTEEAAGEARRGWEAGSFLELYLDHRRAFENEIFPAFARFGVPRPVFPWHPKPLAALARALLPPTLAERDRAFDLLTRLDHADPAVRSQAGRRLAEDFARHRAAIAERLRSPILSPEARFRLRLIQDRYGSGHRLVDRAHAGGLLRDPRFQRLLVEAAPAERRGDLRRMLDRLR